MLKKIHLKVIYLSYEKNPLALHNANGYLMIFFTSCEFGFFILFCLQTTIRVMYVSNYSFCLMYFMLSKYATLEVLS